MALYRFLFAPVLLAVAVLAGSGQPSRAQRSSLRSAHVDAAVGASVVSTSATVRPATGRVDPRQVAAR
jgi:hypothetical protein